MGFILFNSSGVFNPITYGLSAGDQVYVCCVGGGGGGGCAPKVFTTTGYDSDDGSYKQYETVPLTGGTGGTSSFGAYLSALGGAGGVGLTSSTPTYNTSQGQYVVSNAGIYTIAIGGAPGWLPGFPFSGYAPILRVQDCLNLESTVTAVLEYSPWLGGLPSFSSPASGRPSIGTRTLRVKPSVAMQLEPFLYALYTTDTIGASGTNVSSYLAQTRVFRLHAISGGSGNLGADSTDGTAQWYSKGAASGGVGYGAGGGGWCSTYYRGRSGSSNYYFYNSDYAALGGNSGEVKCLNVTLTSANAIAVSVGGGGAGAYIDLDPTYSRSATKPVSKSDTTILGNGADGSAGAAGAVKTSNWSNKGGYGASPAGGDGTDAAVVGTKALCYQRYVGGGGGASGCVAVWW